MTVTTVINRSIELHIESESSLEEAILSHFKIHLLSIDIGTAVDRLDIILKAPK